MEDVRPALEEGGGSGCKTYIGVCGWGFSGALRERHAQFIARKTTLAWFGDDADARERFARYIGGDDADPIDDAFIDEVELPCEPGPSLPRPALEEILARHPGASGIADAHARHGYSLSEIAAALGRSKSSVGRMLVAYEAEAMLTAATWPRAA